MPLSFSEEMLSAYLDGEATPEECALVERLLDEKPELRDQLNSLSDLSQSVQRLPRESAPVDFASSVLEEVNQRRPPQLKSQTADVPASRSSSSRSPRFWVSSLIAMSILIVVGVFLNSSQQLVPKSNLFENASGTLGESADVGTSLDDALAANAETMPAAPRIEADDSSFGLPRDPFSGALSEASPATNAPRVVTLDRDEIASRLSSLQDSPDVGDEFSILAKDQDSPILVDFVVVDVQKSWGRLQVLMKEHSVEPVIVESDHDRDSSGSSGELVAFYLDLDEQDLESVLGQVSAIEAEVVYLSDKTQPKLNASFTESVEQMKRPQSLAIQEEEKIQVQPQSQEPGSSGDQSVSQMGRKREKKFQFDIKNPKLNKKSKAGQPAPMGGEGTSLLNRNGLSVESDREEQPPSPEKPERSTLRKKSSTKQMSASRSGAKSLSPASSARKVQPLSSTIRPDEAETPSVNSPRTPQKDSDRVRTLLIFRKVKE